MAVDTRLVNIIYRVAKMLVSLLEAECGCGRERHREITVVRVEKTVDFSGHVV